MMEAEDEAVLIPVRVESDVSDNESVRKPVTFGGYDFVFVDEPSYEQICSICLVAMRNPVQTACGHRFCRDCLVGTFREGHLPACPQDRNSIPEEGGFFHDVAWERDILSLRVKCKMSERGCDWTGQLRHYQNHSNECKYEDVTCGDCHEEMQRRLLDTHLTLECRQRIVKCAHCKEKFAFWRLKDYNLCFLCYNEKGHEHKIEKLGLDLDVDQQEQGREKERPQLSAQEEPRLKIQRCIQSLVHATHCRDPTCQLGSCTRMKRVVEHTKTCKRKTSGGCRICQELIHLCCYHAKRCLERECVVPFCRHIKLKLRQRQTQQRFAQNQILRRRMAMMHHQSMQPAPQMPGQPMPPNMAGPGNIGQSHPALQQTQ